MIDFFRRLFRQQGSSATAKERLRLVLMTDHLELAPEMIESMKRDLVDVIGRYVEVDREKIEVNFERQDKALAMLANIPILSVTRPSNGNGVSATDGNGVQQHVEQPAADATEAPESTPPPAPPSRKRRKRTRKKAGGGAIAPAPVPTN